MSSTPQAPLHVRSWGDEGAPLVVLLHAGIADARGWEPVGARLAASGLRVLAPDLRGFGDSPDPAGDFRHVDDVLAMLDAHGVDAPVVLVGWSMSGTVALDLALEHPQRVRGLALVCSVPEGLERSAEVHRSWELEDQLLEAGDIDGAIDNDIATWVAGPHRQVAEVDGALVAYVAEVSRALLDREGRAVGSALDGDRDAIGRLGELAMPLLVVTAELDTSCHEAAAERLIADVADARRVDIAATAHLAPMERPDDVARALTTFVESLG